MIEGLLTALTAAVVFAGGYWIAALRVVAREAERVNAMERRLLTKEADRVEQHMDDLTDLRREALQEGAFRTERKAEELFNNISTDLG